MMWDYGPGWSVWMFVMPVVWLVLLGLIVWAVIALVQRGKAPHPTGEGRETPEEILDRRFARGEIDMDAYRQARAHLAEHRPGQR